MTAWLRITLLALLPLAAFGQAVGGPVLSGGAPTDAQYWLGAADPDLPNGILANTISAVEMALSYDFSDATNLTGDIATARMSPNVLAAITAASGNLVAPAEIHAAAGSTTNPSITTSSDDDTGFAYGGAGGLLAFVSNGTYLYRAGEFSSLYGLGLRTAADDADNNIEFRDLVSGTLRGGLRVKADGYWRFHSDTTLTDPANFYGRINFEDPTASTGDTLVIVKGGAGESGNVLEIQNSSGTVNAAFTAAGVMAAVSAVFGPVGASSVTYSDPGTRPTCDSSIRGRTFFDAGGAGVKDDFSICAKDSGDAYAWRTLY